ncbi:hypothetical protein [Kribbella catacumbae]|uniref:hypothetical protein n=1 Tax=Kribbella catacumbae TaxID=460086 RepID=UPI00035CBD54|nr:hypothetical protein [Kribbella catacumbae]
MNRLVLLAYPKAYRDSHGDELLACLTEVHPGREWPPLREATALVRGGVQERARIIADDKSRSWWLEGLQLAALWLALLALVPYLQDVWNWMLHIDPARHAINFHFNGWYPWATGEGTRTRLLPYGLLPLIAFVALLRGRAWIALPAVAAMIYSGITIGTSNVFGDQGVSGASYYGLGAPILAHDIVLPVLLFAACAVLTARTLQRYSYRWLIPVAVFMFVAGGLHLASYNPWFQRGQFVLEVAVIIIAGWATIATRDYRWTIPVAAFAIVRVEAILTDSTLLAFHPQPSTTVLLALAATLPALILATRRNTQLK